MLVRKFVEKPNLEEAPSNLAIIGRYLLTSEIFDILKEQETSSGNEIQLTDAIDTLNKVQRVFAHGFKDQHYDVVDKLNFMKTGIQYGLNHSQIQNNLRALVIELGEKLKSDISIMEKVEQ